MKQRAKEMLMLLKAKDKEVDKIFNEYVELVEKELEIPKHIAVTLAADELVNRFEKKLILHSIFSKATLEKYKDINEDGEHSD